MFKCTSETFSRESPRNSTFSAPSFHLGFCCTHFDGGGPRDVCTGFLPKESALPISHRRPVKPGGHKHTLMLSVGTGTHDPAFLHSLPATVQTPAFECEKKGRTGTLSPNKRFQQPMFSRDVSCVNCDRHTGAHFFQTGHKKSKLVVILYLDTSTIGCNTVARVRSCVLSDQMTEKIDGAPPPVQTPLVHVCPVAQAVRSLQFPEVKRRKMSSTPVIPNFVLVRTLLTCETFEGEIPSLLIKKCSGRQNLVPEHSRPAPGLE